MKIEETYVDYIVLLDAIETYGEQKQMDMVVEECAELINAVMKFRRDRCEVKDITTEMADVVIMIAQLARILNLNAYELEDEIARKMDRLKKRLSEGRAK